MPRLDNDRGNRDEDSNRPRVLHANRDTAAADANALHHGDADVGGITNGHSNRTRRTNLHRNTADHRGASNSHSNRAKRTNLYGDTADHTTGQLLCRGLRR